MRGIPANDLRMNSKKFQKFPKVSNDGNEKTANIFKCETCLKNYNTKSGLFKHKKTCKVKEENNTINTNINNNGISYFPDGFRKKVTDTVSPRALKHIQELTLIKRETKTRCIMCYVIQRTDANRFQPSVIDPEYLRDVNTFMRDPEGWGESSSYFFDDESDDYSNITDQEVEDWAKQEISHYLFSKPDEFPSI